MPLEISEEHEVLIKEFLLQWWLSLSQEVERTSHTIMLPSLNPEELMEQDLGKMLYLIALAAEGKLDHTPETEGEVSMAVFDLLEMLWSRPGCVELVDPPLAFWAGEFGYMVLLADVWCNQDQLITMKDAASLMGVSLQNLRGKINFGVLSEFREIHEANPRRATRLRLREVQQLVKRQETSNNV